MRRCWAGLLMVSALVGAIAFYGLKIEPYWLDVRHLQIPLGAFPEALRGRTALHLSDLHIEEIGPFEERLLEVATGIAPDMIFLTGDYMPWRGDIAPALEFLSRLQAKNGVWAVMGDYDYSNSRQSCLFCHAPGSGEVTQAHQVQFLRNSVSRIDLGAGSLMIGGIDGEAFRAFDAGYESLSGDRKSGMILLSHSPLVFDYVDSAQDLLVLAGDTHGGQIPLPGWLWGLLGYEKNARYNQGWFENGRSRMFVTRGVGTSHLPLRIMRRPEVVVYHFY